MKRMMTLILAVWMLCSCLVPGFAQEQQDIGVYGEYVNRALRVEATLENRHAMVELKDGVQLEVTGAPADAATVSVVQIFSMEEAWAWLDSCLSEEMDVCAAYEVTFLDEKGQRVSNQNTKLTVPEGASVGLYGVDVNGNVTTPSCRIAGGLVQFVADGSEFYVLTRLAPLPPVAKIGDTEYETVAQALAQAKAGDRVQLIADAAEAGTVVIPVGVTLDLGSHTLEAGYVIGVNGGLLTATPNQGKLVMNKDALILGREGYQNEEGMYVLPLWDPSENCYQFCLFEVNSDPGKNRGLTIDEEAGVLYFQFKHRATEALNKRLLGDGAGDNATAVIVRLQWTNANGTAYQDFYYNDLQVGKVTGSFDYTFTLTGYSALNIDLNTLKVQAMVVTDSGATAFGTVWDHTNAK